MSQSAIFNIAQLDQALLITEVFLGLVLAYLLTAFANTQGYSINWLPIPRRRFASFWAILFILSVGIAQFLGLAYGVLAVILAACILISFLSSTNAVAVFASAFLLRPWELVAQQPETMTYIPKILACVCLCSCLFHMFTKRQTMIVWNAPLLVFMALLTWLFMSAMFSGDMQTGLQYLFKHFYPILVLTLLIVNIVKDRQGLSILCTAIVLSVCGVIMTACYETFLAAYDPIYGYRLHTSTFWGNPNDLGALILIALPFVFFPHVLRAKNLEVLTLGCVMSGILLLGLFATQSRGALLGLAIATMLYFIAGKGKKFFISLGLVAFIASTFVFIIAQRGSEDRSTSDVSRFTYVKAGINMLKSDPLFGVGIGNYPKEYSNYSPDFFEWGERNAHSSWVLVLAEAGLIGFTLFTLLFVITFRRAWALRAIRPEYLCALAGYGTTMSLLSHTYTFPPYLLFALIIAARKVYENGLQADTDLVLSQKI